VIFSSASRCSMRMMLSPPTMAPAYTMARAACERLGTDLGFLAIVGCPRRRNGDERGK